MQYVFDIELHLSDSDWRWYWAGLSDLVVERAVMLPIRVTIRLILIGEAFFQIFQSLEIIGDMYQ